MIIKLSLKGNTNSTDGCNKVNVTPNLSEKTQPDSNIPDKYNVKNTLLLKSQHLLAGYIFENLTLNYQLTKEH